MTVEPIFACQFSSIDFGSVGAFLLGFAARYTNLRNPSTAFLATSKNNHGVQILEKNCLPFEEADALGISSLITWYCGHQPGQTHNCFAGLLPRPLETQVISTSPQTIKNKPEVSEVVLEFAPSATADNYI